jgi:translocation protein SEC63
MALPAWIVDPENKFIVLAFYSALFGILLPVVVGKWWSKSKKFTKDRVLNYTMGLFFQEVKESFNVKKMLELLCAAVEFKECIPDRGKRDLEAVMALFRTVRDTISSKTGEKIELPKKVPLIAFTWHISILLLSTPLC